MRFLLSVLAVLAIGAPANAANGTRVIFLLCSLFLLSCRTKMSNPLPEDDNMFDDVDVGLPPVGGGNAISTSEDGNVDALLKELDSEFAIGGDSDEEDQDVLDLDGGASDVAAATPSVVESAIESLAVSSAKMANSSTMGLPANNGATSSSVPSTSTATSTPVYDGNTGDPVSTAGISSSEEPAAQPTASTSTAHSSDANDSVQRLRSSTANLTQSISRRAETIDQRYNLRESVSQSVSKLDSDYNIKEKTSSLWSSLRGGVALVGGSIAAGASTVESKYNLSEKATDVKATVAEKAKEATSEIGNAVAPTKEALKERFGDKIDKFGAAVGSAGSSVREFDKKFGISTKAVGALADGANALAKGLGEESGSATADDVGVDDTAAVNGTTPLPVTREA